MQILDSLPKEGKRAVCIGVGAAPAIACEILNHALTWHSYDGTDSSMSLIRYGGYHIINAALLASAGAATHYAANSLNDRFVLIKRRNDYSRPVSVKSIAAKSSAGAVAVYAAGVLLSVGLSSVVGRISGNCADYRQYLTNPVCFWKGDGGFSSTMNSGGRVSFALGLIALMISEIYFMIYLPKR
jgi:hypothetical protein